MSNEVVEPHTGCRSFSQLKQATKLFPFAVRAGAHSLIVPQLIRLTRKDFGLYFSSYTEFVPVVDVFCRSTAQSEVEFSVGPSGIPSLSHTAQAVFG